MLTAATPREAVTIAEKYEGPINLLLTDVIMPEMNGNELSQKLHAMLTNLKTLFMSGYTTEIISHHQINSDEANFIQKPFSANTLLNAVQKSLNPLNV